MPPILSKKGRVSPLFSDRPTYYLGIDPGTKGGLALIQEDRVIETLAMPESIWYLWEWISRISSCDPIAMIEQVTGSVPKKDDAKHGGQPGSHMFAFGKNVGHLQALLMVANITPREINSKVWQNRMGIPKKKKTDTQSQHKGRIKAVAVELFPGAKITLETSDAIVIAEFCRRVHQGAINA